jgi:hypothetical protein
MQIELLTSVVGAVDLPAGYIGEVDDNIAKDLIKAGHAQQVNASKPSNRAEKPASPAAKAETR